MYIPPGFTTVAPYIVADDAQRLLAFLVAAFDGDVRLRTGRPDGKIANAQIRIGEATIMVSDSAPGHPATRSAFYLYVADADDAMRRAIAAGARMEMEVADMPYGDRQGGVRDPSDNVWWISQRLIAAPYSE
jgi:PhnB protein